ncbi:P-loop containing nucleoside triphosphate hydrolase protein [Gigaspora rosea]|uniref:(d)CMP kinase n=1 Tax=Gigaspora rosea TaxID=44941 RepID=A0A397U982_9GLOM|nr:P-loop containing nucleoside triphosphate hydrolase protein [Gigaspora rosea]
MINIAIDGPIVSGKTTVGKLIAENLNYQFIDTEVFYCYLGYKYSIYNNTLIDDLKKNFKNKNILNEINTFIKNLSEEDYFYSEQQAAELSKNVELCEKINLFLCEITKEKGFVVVGNLLPDAEIKIFLSADIDIRALRRARQLKLNDITNDIWLDILNQDSKSFDLIEEAKKVSKIIDTTNLTLANVVDLQI